MVRVVHTLVLLAATACAFDFDEDEDIAPSGAGGGGGSFGGSGNVVDSAQLLHAIGGGSFSARGQLFYHDASQVRLTNSKLEGTAADALNAALASGAHYSVSLPSSLRDASSPRVVASVSACALVASGLRENIHLTMGTSDQVLAISYTVHAA